jgi:uncharacterized phage protein gp47/JayE
MSDFPSRLDLYKLARTYVLTRAQKIDPAQVDVAGSDVNLYVGIASVLGYQLVMSLAQNVNALMLDGAYGDDLDRYGTDRYQLPRKGAAAAVGNVRIFRSTAAAGAGTIPMSTPLLTLNGIEYITSNSVSFGATDLVVTVNVRASIAGKTSQVGANQIRQFGQPQTLFDQTLQVNNDLPTAGGEDTEDDETYRERIRAFWNTARRGTLSAIQYGATAVPGVSSATAVEVLTNGTQPARAVSLRIADSSGIASAALAATVQASLDEYRAAGIAVLVETSTPQIVSVVLKLTFSASVDSTILSENVRAAVVEYINSLAVGETLYKSSLFAVLQRYQASGLIVTQDTLVSPAGDLVPDTGKTLRTRLANVTVV